MRFHVSEHTVNRKLGNVLTSSASRDSCPKRCPLKKNGCYGENYPMRFHWDALDAGTRGSAELWDHVMQLEHMSRGRMVRLYQIGNLPRDIRSARRICNAPADASVVWTYDHYKDIRRAKSLKRTRTTVNTSADTLAEADRWLKAGVPTVVLQPDESRSSRTPGGKLVVRCPAEWAKGITCETCGGGKPLCARKDRTFAVGFSPHGSGRAKAREVACR